MNPADDARSSHEDELDCALRAAFAAPERRDDGPTDDGTMPPERACSVVEEIARGGMGVVYRARDPVLGREVALKMLRADLAGDEAAVARFLAEARAVGALQHPGVVPVYALGRTPTGRPWFTMKLIEGRTLASLLAARSRPDEDLRRFVAVVEAVARTIAYAHQRGIAHLDLKPGNVMLGAFEEIQVVDWGLAALVADRDRASRAEGTVLGTPAYMAPEQARGDVACIGERTDVFALGAILCEVLTGEPPHPSGRHATRREAAEGRVDAAIVRVRATADPELARICELCLAARPEDRPSGALEVAEAIALSFASLAKRARAAEIAAAEARTRAAAERRARRATIALAATAIAAILVVTALAFANARRDARTRAAVDERASAALADAALLLGRAESDDDLALHAQAAAAVARAEEVLSTGTGSVELVRRASSLRGRIHAAEIASSARAAGRSAERTLFRRVEDLRTFDDRFSGPEDDARRDEAYAECFRAAGIDVGAVGFAADARSRGIALELAAALDAWAATRRGACRARGADELHALARALDPDPAREAARAAIASASLPELARVVDGTDIARLRPATLHAIHRAIGGAEELRNVLATRLLVAAHAAHPLDFPIAIQLARRLFEAGDVGGGELVYRIAHALRPDHPDAFLELGWELEHRDIDFASACELLRRAAELAPDDGLTWFCYGRALRRVGDLAGAASAQRAAELRMPGDPRPWKELAVVYRASGELEMALDQIEHALARDPGNWAIRSERAATLAKLGRIDEALDDCRVIGAREGDPRAWEARAALLVHEHGDVVAAARTLRALGADARLAVLPLVTRGARIADYLDLEAVLLSGLAELTRYPLEPTGHCVVGAVLAALGRPGEAAAALRTGHTLGIRQPAWSHPSLAWLAGAEIEANSEARLLRVLAGRAEPADARDGIALARIAARKQLDEIAADLFEAALGREPALAAEPFVLLDAACAGLAAGAPRSGADAAGEGARARRRDRALRRAEDGVVRLRSALRAGPDDVEQGHTLDAWRASRALEETERLPDAERVEWKRLRREIDALAHALRTRVARR